MEKLTKNQEKILSYLRKCAQKGLPPSVREICNATGLKSTSTVHAHLKTLEKKGYIARDTGLNRAIHIFGCRSIQVPVVKNFRKGTSIFTSSDIERYISYATLSDIEGELFAFYILDDSMEDSAILANDIIISSKKTDDIKSGDIVVALYKQKPIVRYYLEKDDYKGLISENMSYSPIELGDSVYIIGKVISVIRYLQNNS